jgi:hypothetical protein
MAKEVFCYCQLVLMLTNICGGKLPVVRSYQNDSFSPTAFSPVIVPILWPLSLSPANSLHRESSLTLRSSKFFTTFLISHFAAYVLLKPGMKQCLYTIYIRTSCLLALNKLKSYYTRQLKLYAHVFMNYKYVCTI